MAKNLFDVISRCDAAAAAALVRFGVNLPSSSRLGGLPLPLLLAFFLLCCVCCVCFLVWLRQHNSHGFEPLLPYAMRSHAPMKHPERSLINTHEGRVCRASVLEAPASPSARPCASTHVHHFCGATAASAEPPATAPNDASPQCTSGVHRHGNEHRSVCVTDDIEEVEGGHGGGWGDLDGFSETITISRHEHPTSRRGGDRDTARRAYLEAVGPPTGDRTRAHALAPNSGQSPAARGQAPRGRSRR